MAIEYQKGLTEVDSAVSRAAYNLHGHSRSCFGKEEKKSNKSKMPKPIN
jgi:hypothetical protein